MVVLLIYRDVRAKCWERKKNHKHHTDLWSVENHKSGRRLSGPDHHQNDTVVRKMCQRRADEALGPAVKTARIPSGWARCVRRLFAFSPCAWPTSSKLKWAPREGKKERFGGVRDSESHRCVLLKKSHRCVFTQSLAANNFQHISKIIFTASEIALLERMHYIAT